MAYDEALADRIRDVLTTEPSVEEKKMFGGIAFMVDGKMCVGVIKNDLMVRLDPEIMADVLKRKGARPMDFTSRPMKGYVYVDPSGVDKEADLKSWIALGLDYNPKATAAKKRPMKKPSSAKKK